MCEHLRSLKMVFVEIMGGLNRVYLSVLISPWKAASVPCCDRGCRIIHQHDRGGHGLWADGKETSNCKMERFYLVCSVLSLRARTSEPYTLRKKLE